MSSPPAEASVAAEPLLWARQLAFEIDGRRLWRELDLSLQPGERLGITGPSGSGKTLLLRTLAGLEPLQHGELEFRGRALADWSMPKYRAGVAYLAQRPSLREGSVEATLRAPFGFGVRRGVAYPVERAQSLLSTLWRDADFLRQRAERLSGGEAQIVALLRALLVEPQILLLDEPTASLDAATVEAVEQLVTLWLAADGKRSYIWTSHDASQLARSTDRRLSLASAA